MVALRISQDGEVSAATVVRLWEVRVLLLIPKSYRPTAPLQPGGTFPKPRELLIGSFGDPENWHEVSFLFLEGLSGMRALNPESGP